MSKLTPDVASELEAHLRCQRTEVLALIRTRLHSSDDPELMALANHLEQTGGDGADAGLDLALLDHELAELRDIDTALKRLADGVAGQCAECGTQIPLGRLQANPVAHTCIACQEQLEKRGGGKHHAAI